MQHHYPLSDAFHPVLVTPLLRPFQPIAHGHLAAARLEAGYVWINDCSAHFIGAPFGGYKQSGLGCEESKEELFEFTQIKNVNVSMH